MQPVWRGQEAALAAWLQGQLVDMVAWWQDQTAGMPLELVALQEMAAPVALGLARSALLVVSDVEEAEAVALWRMSVLARGTTFRRPPTSTSGTAGTSM